MIHFLHSLSECIGHKQERRCINANIVTRDSVKNNIGRTTKLYTQGRSLFIANNVANVLVYLDI